MTEVPSDREGIVELVQEGQRRLVSIFQEIDGGRFDARTWERPGGGGGTARMITDGRVFERGGVNVSVVRGKDLPEEMRTARDLPAGIPFFATGISMVLHPRNPHVAAFHANFRYFEAGDREDWWFGGGADLTPAYPVEADVREFHGVLRDLCDRHEVADHARFKAWCDDYFTVRHRGEMRGVGGIFFDHLKPDGPGGWEAAAAFMADGIRTLESAYPPLVRRRQDTPWSETERRWQLLRRGRYAEFNLVYDRGTRFGLDTGGDTEAILMSLPPLARWETQADPEPGTPEAASLPFFQPRSWTTAPSVR
ncbi:MAG: oxygen-dependent coproporphyrinogen oxidase [Gemmatimonadota bacterium]